MKTFTHIAVGGTFDRFHKGHQRLVFEACQSGRAVSIGILKEKIEKNRLSGFIQPYAIREKQVEAFVKKHGYEKKTRIITIYDAYGPAIEDATMDAIFVTKETKQNAVRINAMRKKQDLKTLAIIAIPFEKSEDKKIIRSTRIREGNIDRLGHVYSHIFKKKRVIHLPFHLRERLRRPLGAVVSGSEKNIDQTTSKVMQKVSAYHFSLLITVGDVISQSMKQSGMQAHICVVDFRTRREEKNQLKRIFPYTKRFVNVAGTISKQAFFACKKAIHDVFQNQNKQVVAIRGEEDLLALPMILLAPLGSLVLYGQFDTGVIIVEVTEEKKQEIADILSQFT